LNNYLKTSNQSFKKKMIGEVVIMVISQRVFLLNLCIMIMGFCQEWVVRYNGPGNLGDVASAIAVDDSGYIYVTGQSTGSGTASDFATLKYDQSGNEIWVARYDNGNFDSACAITVDDKGNVYITGTSCKSGTYNNYDWATIKYSRNGVEQWVARYNGPKDSLDQPSAIGIDNRGNVYVTGYCDKYFQSSSGDYLTIKYDSLGVEQWQARYDGTALEGDRAQALCLDSIGDVYITGLSTELNTYTDITTIKYDTNGNIRWIAIYAGPYTDYGGKAIAVDNLSNVYITGTTFNSGTRDDYITIKYESSGVQQWVRYFGILEAAPDEASALAVDNFGNVYVTGQGTNYYSYDYATVKYDSLGNEQWIAWYDGGANETDGATAIAIDESSNVYVTGYSYSSTGDDYVTVRYNSAGIEQWSARYNGPGNSTDRANAVALDKAGNVYVTGMSFGTGTDYDYATLKYSSTGPGIKENLPSRWIDLTFKVSPNPFSRQTAISFTVMSLCGSTDNGKIVHLQDCKTSLRIYDATGRLVRQWDYGTTRLSDCILWDGTDDAGYKLPSGVYFIHLRHLDNTRLEKAVILR